MIPIKFSEQNGELGTNPAQKEINGYAVGTIPVFSDGEQCISCWKLSFKERILILLSGRIWLGVCSGYTQPPVWMCVRGFSKK